MKTIVVIASVVLALTGGSAFAKKAGTVHAAGGHTSSVAHAGTSNHAAKVHAKKGGKRPVAKAHTSKSHQIKAKAKPKFKSKLHGGKKISSSGSGKHAASLR